MKAASDKLSLALRAIADPTRRRILHLLNDDVRRRNGDGIAGWCASDLEQKIKLAQPTISHHMKILKTAGLVETRKFGTWVSYHRSEAALRELRRDLKDSI